ncbi:MAG: DedA family protein, partial [Bacteroidia bacterium]
YFLSRSGSKFVQKRVKKRHGFIEKYKEKLRTNMGKTVLTLCFIPRMRYWCPILIGSMSLPLKRFMLFDAIGLVVFCALYVSLGLVFHASLQSLLKKVQGSQNIIFFGSVVVFAIIITVIMIRRKRKEETPETTEQ